eukprot:scaffold61381_cov33-Tisochrysis_lutea.AAC.1
MKQDVRLHKGNRRRLAMAVEHTLMLQFQFFLPLRLFRTRAPSDLVLVHFSSSIALESALKPCLVRSLPAHAHAAQASLYA